jgi:hypothetical protein
VSSDNKFEKGKMFQLKMGMVIVASPIKLESIIDTINADNEVKLVFAKLSAAQKFSFVESEADPDEDKKRIMKHD